jgi:hypothetical protein
LCGRVASRHELYTGLSLERTREAPIIIIEPKLIFDSINKLQVPLEK